MIKHTTNFLLVNLKKLFGLMPKWKNYHSSFIYQTGNGIVLVVTFEELENVAGWNWSAIGTSLKFPRDLYASGGLFPTVVEAEKAAEDWWYNTPAGRGEL